MSDPTIRALIPSTSAGEAWKAALAAAARVSGRKAEIVSEIDKDAVGRGWLVLVHEQPSRLWCELRQAWPHLAPRDVLTRASAILAQAAEAVRRGACPIPSEALRLHVDGLGDVERQETTRFDELEDRALDIYAVPPPAMGVEARWGVAHFSYPVGDGFDGGQPEMDLTGRYRILVHGPYIVLPPGCWRVEAEFEIDTEGGLNRLRFDWGVGDDLETTSIQISQPGAYTLALTRRWVDAGPAQLRIWSEQAAFQGRFSFKGCIVRPAPDPEVDDSVERAAGAAAAGT